jgi:hypothetical protein
MDQRGRRSQPSLWAAIVLGWSVHLKGHFQHQTGQYQKTTVPDHHGRPSVFSSLDSLPCDAARRSGGRTKTDQNDQNGANHGHDEGRFLIRSHTNVIISSRMVGHEIEGPALVGIARVLSQLWSSLPHIFCISYLHRRRVHMKSTFLPRTRGQLVRYSCGMQRDVVTECRSDEADMIYKRGNRVMTDSKAQSHLPKFQFTDLVFSRCSAIDPKLLSSRRYLGTHR